ncbi:hypothetical protein DdX_18171 [Ditylenchus destructor]|uniref:Uncharacterized protein n=1 Tax=Ditylenchus destructor TaxID=166010 RepID=A0AAD4MKQ7_9BILA|nr:hypothetical protein DdX_18171 [Ditylenchus destructor]
MGKFARDDILGHLQTYKPCIGDIDCKCSPKCSTIEENVEHGHIIPITPKKNFICDLDPSMLVVTNSRNYVQKGYGHEKKQYGSKDGYDNKDNYGGKNEGHGYGDKSDYGHPKTKEYGNSGYNKGGYGQEGYGHNEGHGEGYGHGHGDGYGNEGGYGNDNYGHHQALAARRDRSVSKDSIIGFIVDYDQIQHSYGSNQGSGYGKKDDYGSKDGYGRKKRDAAPPGIKPLGEGAQRSTNYEQGGNQPAYNKEGYENKGQDYGKEEYGDNKGGYEKKESYGGEGYGNNDYGYVLHRPPVPYFPPYNPRCVCCAPKRHHHYNHGNGYGNNHHNKGYGHEEAMETITTKDMATMRGGQGYGGGYEGPGHGYGNDGYNNGYEGGKGYGGSYGSHGRYGAKNEGYGAKNEGYGGKNEGYEGGAYGPHNKDHYGGGGGDYKYGA